MNTTPSDIRPLVFMLSGLLIWFAHLSVIYAFTALACARGFADAQVAAIGIVPLVVGAATLLALLGLAALLRLALRGRARPPADDAPVSRFLRYMTTAIAVLALVAVLWQALPLLFVSPCV